MRRIFAVLGLLLVIALPALADDWSDGPLRIQRKQPSTQSVIENDQVFSQPPLTTNSGQAGNDSGVASFTLDTTKFQNPESNRFQAFDTTRFQTPNPVLPVVAPLERAAVNLFNRLTNRDLQILSTRDVIVLIDKSGSMGDKDCPPVLTGLQFISRVGDSADTITRWDWCEQELLSLSRNAGSALPNGLRVVLFDGQQTIYDRVNIGQIPQIFQNNYPEGSTNEAAALSSQLEWYFSRKAAQGGRARPVVIAVITDGLPNSSSALKKVIIEATRSMQNRQEIAITFLQIGNDKKGVKLVHELDDNLKNEGAVYDIVDSKDFSELTKIGLGKALVDAINEAGQEGI